MLAKLTVFGAYPVGVDEACRLVEILVGRDDAELDFGEITQEVKEQARDNWQVPYDEQVLEQRGGTSRSAFFFHYLDFDKPLLTPLGPVSVPKTTLTPNHLKNIKYEAC